MARPSPAAPISIGGGTINTAAAGSGNVFTISSTLAGAGGLTLAANGDISDTGGGAGGALLLSGENTFTGKVTITSGMVRANSSFGDAGNTLVLNGGGIVDSTAGSTFTRNIEVGAAGGIIRLYGSTTTDLTGSISNVSGVASTSLKHTDGGTLRLGGSGAGFAGTFNNARGNLEITAANASWANTNFLLNGSGGTLTFSGGGTAMAKSITTTSKNAILNNGTILDVPAFTWSTSSGGSWITNTAGAEGKLTSSTGTLTLTNGSLASGNLETDDNQVNVVIENSGATPVAVVKNNNNGLILNRANTHSGGTTINAGRVQAGNAGNFGSGTVTVNGGGQAYLAVAGTYPNHFVISGLGVTETAGTLGAIRFQGNTVSGDINVAAASRITAHSGASGTHSGVLTGSADLEINSTAANSNGTLNFTGTTSGYTGTMMLSQGRLNVGALGGGLSVSGGRADVSGALGGELSVSGGSANVSGAVAGDTTLSAGILNLNSGASISSPTLYGGTLNVGAGATVTGNAETLADATISVAGSITGDVILDSGDVMGLAGGSVGGGLTMGATSTTGNVNTLNFSKTLAVAGNLELHGLQMVDMNAVPAPGVPATLITYGGSASDPDDLDILNNFELNNPEAWRGSVFANTGGAITLSLGGEVTKWTGADTENPTFWDTAALNWTSSDKRFFNSDSVTFDDTAATFSVALQGLLRPSAITFNNTANNYDITGVAGQGFAGSTGIVKNGTASVTLAGFAHSYTGAVQINAGILKAGGYEALGNTSGVTIAAGGQLDLNGKNLGSGTRAYSVTIAGAGPGGLGAITNTSATAPSSNAGIQNLTLSGPASIGGNGGRFDVGLANGFPVGSIVGNGHTLTKVGTGQVQFRGHASGLDLVIAAGMGCAENTGNALGGTTGSVTVKSGAILSAYGALSIPTPVTLEGNCIMQSQGGGTPEWTGDIAITGSDVNLGGTSDNSFALTGNLSGNTLLTKGSGTLYLENPDNSGFTGKWLLDTNSIYVADDLSFGSVPAAFTADYFTVDNVRIGSGTRAAPGNLTIHANRGITMTHLLVLNPGAGGSITINGPIAGASPTVQYTADITKDSNTGSLTFNGDVVADGKFTGNGGTTTFNGNLTLTEGMDVAAGMVTHINSPTISVGAGAEGFHAWQGITNLNIGSGTFADLELGDGGTQPHTVNHLGGNLTVTHDMRIGHYGGATCVYNISAGSLSMPDTVTGPTDEAQANLFIGIDGTGILNISSSGVVNTSSLVVNGRGGATPDTLNLTGGRLNIGKWGIRNPGASAVNLGGGILGAYADWSSTTPMTLNGGTTVNTLDSVNASTPRTISLNADLAGTGGLLKQGAGTLVLGSNANTFSGTAEVEEGIMYVNSATEATLKTSGGDLRPGTPAAIGTPTAAAVEFAGGSATFRVGDFRDELTTADLTVSAPTSIGLVPTRQLTAADAFTLISYDSLSGFGNLSVSLSNPHYAASIMDDTANQELYVTIDAADSITWSGAINGAWDVNATSNWVLDSTGTTSSRFYDFDVVTFDDGGIGQPVVTLTGDIKPALLTVENSGGTYTFQGSGLSGGLGLTKAEAGGLILASDNTFTGLTDVKGGTVQIGAGASSGSVAGNIALAAGTTLKFDRADAFSVTANDGQTISGEGAVEFNGSGTMTLAGRNPFTGGLTVNSGTVLLSGGGWYENPSQGKGMLTVNAGAVAVNWNTHAYGGSYNPDVDMTLNGGTFQVRNGTYVDDVWMTGGTIENYPDSTAQFQTRGGGGTVVTVEDSAIQSVISCTYFTGEGASIITVNDPDTDFLISGKIVGDKSITKNGPGTLLLTGDNSTYSGGFDVTEGSLKLGSTVSQLGAGYLALKGGTLEYTGTGAETFANALWVDGADTAGTFDITVASAFLTMAPTTGTMNQDVIKTGPGRLRMQGVLSGEASITANGGRLDLDAINTNTGNTTINAGATVVMTYATLDDASTLRINGSGKLNLDHGTTDTVAVLEINGTPMAAGTYGSSSSDASHKDDTHFTGSGMVNVTGGQEGGYETWASGYGLTGSDALRDSDPDMDGFSNQQEFLFGTSPLAGNGSLLNATAANGNLVLRWLQRETGATYKVLESQTLASGSWALVFTPAPGLDSDQNGAPADYDYFKVTLPIIRGSKRFFTIEGEEN